MIDEEMASKNWAAGDTFTLADCAAFPALFYANKVAPFPDGFANVAGYFDAADAASVGARVSCSEAEPYFAMFPDSKEA